MSTKIRDIQLENGRNKKGQVYNRHIQFQPGMESLVNIVAGLQKDVKRINQALTLDGARAYIQNKPNWSAHEEDIVGPDGKPDGIKEVFVADGKGNVKIINGYSLGKSSYPLRKLHRTIYPTRDSRRGHPLNALKAELKEVVDFNPETGPVMGHPINSYNNITEQNANQFNSLVRDVSPREYFKQIFFAPNYMGIKETGAFNELPPMVQAQVFNKGLSRSYNQLIRDEILGRYQIVPSMTPKSRVDKFMKQPAIQREAIIGMYDIQQNQNALFDLNHAIAETIERVLAEITGNAPPSEPAQIENNEEDNDY